MLRLIVLLLVVELSSSTTYRCNPAATCGCSTNAATLTRIVGGESAGSQTWGWAVSLHIGNSLCGGTIISSSWILTAAHCVWQSSANQITVYAGSNAKLAGNQIRSVSRVYTHSSYSSSTYVNDIALLQLSTALNMSDPSVDIICLPSISAATLAAGEWPPALTTVTNRMDAFDEYVLG
jgi:secreted trypsin-like serine protease